MREFTIGTVERPVMVNGARRVRGPWAIRVPQGEGEGAERVFPPCAYVAATGPPVPLTALNSCLYEDAEEQRLLCYLVEEKGEGGERRFRAHDGRGEAIGTVRRLPPSRKFFKRPWRIEQPGHPEIVGRNEWASAGTTGFALRVTGRAAGGVAESLLYDESIDYGKGRQSRQREWWSDSELVMVSQSIKLIAIQAAWPDRRLAFAFAVLGDS